MPPKPKFSKDEIIRAAYEVAREDGIDAVVARTVGKKLGTTATPIFTFFSGMEELKEEVYQKAKADCIAYLGECVRYFPAFKEFGLRWVRFAISQPHLFRLLFTDGSASADVPDSLMREFSDVTGPVLRSIMTGFHLNEQDARELFHQMILHANGIAAFCMNHPGFWDEAETSRLLSEACIGLVLAMQIRNGSFDRQTAEKMIAANPNAPVKIENTAGHTGLTDPITERGE